MFSSIHSAHRLAGVRSRRALAVPVFLALVGAVLLSSCGGGGGPADSPAAMIAPVAPVVCSPHIVADSQVNAGATAGATVLGCMGALSDVHWTQLDGPPVELLTARSQSVSFTTMVAGTVTLKAEITELNGAPGVASAAIEVIPAAGGNSLAIRGDHSVREGDAMSLRAWPQLASGEAVASLNWSQLSGPAAHLVSSNAPTLVFDAPAVTQDTLLSFRAAMLTNSGRESHADVTVVVEDLPAPPKGAVLAAPPQVHAYRATSPYVATLARCAADPSLYFIDLNDNNLCNVATLPLIAIEAGAGNLPSIEQIMGRVLVTHDFLGANLENFLLSQDPHGDFRRLFGGVTAIVLGSNLRPSRYNPLTGAFYLDGDYLWLTAAQRDLISETADPRSTFDDGLNYVSLGRLVKNNAYAGLVPSISKRASRPVSDLIYSLGRLLYHELAHASDFFPPTDRTLDPTKSIRANVADRLSAGQLPSDLLAAAFPLHSQELIGLARVSFFGVLPTPQQSAYTPTEVGGFLGLDIGTELYAYSAQQGGNSREDLAVMFEEFMMSYRHATQHDVAFTSPIAPAATSNNILVAWGERGRIAEPGIKPRLKLVLQKIAPWIDGAAVDSLPGPIMMTPGTSWAASLVLGNSIPRAASLQFQPADLGVPDRLREDMSKRDPHLGLPGR